MVKEFFRKYITTENILLFLMVSTGALLGFAFVLEYFVDLVPCPLCIVQRFFYLFIGISALVGLFASLSSRLIGGVVVLWAIIGGGVALRQVWLQHFPTITDSTGCAVSFGSFLDSALFALGGRGNCGIVDWTFLTFSIAEWSLVWFGIFLGVGIWLAAKEKRNGQYQ
ncbi:MAG: disulfide bond formation protein B [Candidatus Moranbacteria bacterium]|nr:disulfide bond formation protein B [Candidatus Moranbacteria bacterium]